MINKNIFLILPVLLISILNVNAAPKGEKLIWGINAIDLGLIGNVETHGRASVLENLLAGKNVVALSDFYRGDNSSVTPSECRIAYNADTLCSYLSAGRPFKRSGNFLNKRRIYMFQRCMNLYQ